MKKIQVTRPVNLNFRGSSIFLKPGQPHIVDDEVAGYPYLSAYLKSVEDIEEAKPAKPAKAKKKAKK